MIDVKVWQLSEYSPSLDTNPKDKPKVRKVELFSRKNILKNRTKKNKSKDGNILDIIKKRNKTLNN